MKLKKKKNKHFILVLIALVLFTVCFKINNKPSETSNSRFINNILYMSNSHLNNNKESNIVYDVIDIVSNIEVEKPVSIINQVLPVETKKVDIMEFAYIQNTIVDNPRVYIYSTHPNEQYSDGTNVVDASLALQQRLNSIGIQTIVEPRNAINYMKENNISASYAATRAFLKDALKENDYDLIIDLHRDQVPSGVSTKVSFGNKNYAKVMFVMNTSYKDNYKLAEQFNDILYKKNSSFTRGIYDRYNDAYNQDVDSNVILIELGSTQNNYEEISNSIDILVEAIKELINER